MKDADMTRIDYRMDDGVAVITLNDGENRFNPDFIGAFLDTLDAIETQTDAAALVTTSAHEKIFSNCSTGSTPCSGGPSCPPC